MITCSGYTLNEAKRALRATKGDVSQAVTYITDLKEQENRVKAKKLLEKYDLSIPFIKQH